MNATTPKGKVAIKWARKGLTAWGHANPDRCWLETKQDRWADLDAVIGSPHAQFPNTPCCEGKATMMYTGGEVEELMEIKARFNVTTEKFFEDWGGTWLVTYAKLKRCYDTAFSMRTDLAGLLVLVDSMQAYYTKLAKYNPDTGGLEWQIKFKVLKTETQKNINGGKALRENAFIDMNGAEGIPI